MINHKDTIRITIGLAFICIIFHPNRSTESSEQRLAARGPVVYDQSCHDVASVNLVLGSDINDKCGWISPGAK